MSGLTKVLLLHADAGNAAARGNAEAALREAEDASFERYAGALLEELSEEARPRAARVEAAGLLVRCVCSRDPFRRQEVKGLWLGASDEVRAPLRNMALLTLSSPLREARLAAAQAAASIARCELPGGGWEEFVAHVCGAAQPPPDGPCRFGGDGRAVRGRALREASLMCIGWLCEETELCTDLRAHLRPYAADLLTPVAAALRKEEGDGDVRRAGARALLLMLDFADAIMAGAASGAERDYVMRVLCEAASPETSPDEQTRLVSVQCLTRIAANYYAGLEGYMQFLFSLTVRALRRDTDPVAMQAVEFWVTMCEVEVELLECERVAQNPVIRDTRETRCRHYVRGAAGYLMELLWECLLKQDETADEEEWTLCGAAAGCVQAVANCIGDAVLPHAMPLVNKHIDSDGWREQEAATMLFAALLEGASTAGPLAPVLPEAVPLLLRRMRSPNVLVRETTAWGLGRVAEFHSDAIGDKCLRPALEVLVGALADPETRIAAKASYAVMHIAAALGADEDPSELSNGLSPYFQVVVAALLQAADREDAHRNGLRPCAWEALRSCCGCASRDCFPVLEQLMPVVIGRLQASVAPAGGAPRDDATDAQLCALAATLVRKLSAKDVRPSSDSLMRCLVIFAADPQHRAPPPSAEAEKLRQQAAEAAGTSEAARLRHGGLREEALGCVAAVAGTLVTDFARYCGAAVPPLLAALRKWDEARLVRAAASCLSDVLCSARGAMEPFADEVMLVVLRALRTDELSRSVKPVLVACLGFVAVAIGAHYKRFIEVAVAAVCAAAETLDRRVRDDPAPSPEIRDLRWDTREACCTAYSGMLQGLKHCDGGMPGGLSGGTVGAAVAQLHLTARERAGAPPAVARAAAELAGDVADACGRPSREVLGEACVTALLDDLAQSNDPALRDTAEAVNGRIKKLYH